MISAAGIARGRLQGRRRRHPLPRQVWPALLERAYGNAMVSHLAVARAALKPLESEMRGLVDSAKRARGDGLWIRDDATGLWRVDAGEGKKAQGLIDRARAAMRGAVSPNKVEGVAREFAQKTQTYQRKQLGKQVRAALGVDKPFRDRHLSDLMDQFVAHNVSLIRSVPEDVHDDVERLVLHAVSGGRLSGDLADEIDDRFDVGESHARLIARDQIGKLYGQVNHARQRELGVERFVWRTMGDDRVRDEHADFEDESQDEPYSYDDPPVDEDGEPVLPGEPIQCRCYAEPVFEDVLDDDDAGGDESDDADDDSGD